MDKNDEKKIEKIKVEARKEYVPILQDASLRLIETLVEMKKPRRILEIGTAVGYSAINMCKHMESDGKITTVELDKVVAELARKNIIELGMEKQIEVINADGEETMKKLVEDGKIFDIVFIDAAKGQYVRYLEQAFKLTRSSSVIIADNVLFKGMVMGGYNEHKHRTAVTRLREYINIVTTDERLESVILDIGDGVAVSVVK